MQLTMLKGCCLRRLVLLLPGHGALPFPWASGCWGTPLPALAGLQVDRGGSGVPPSMEAPWERWAEPSTTWTASLSPACHGLCSEFSQASRLPRGASWVRFDLWFVFYCSHVIFYCLWKRRGGGRKGASRHPISRPPSGTQSVPVIGFPESPSASASVCALSFGWWFPLCLSSCSQASEQGVVWLAADCTDQPQRRVSHSLAHAHPTKNFTLAASAPVQARSEHREQHLRLSSRNNLRSRGNKHLHCQRRGGRAVHFFRPAFYLFFLFSFFPSLFCPPERGKPACVFLAQPRLHALLPESLLAEASCAGVPVLFLPAGQDSGDAGAYLASSEGQDGGVYPLGAVLVPGLGLPVPGAGGCAEGSLGRAAAAHSPGSCAARPGQSRCRWLWPTARRGAAAAPGQGLRAHAEALRPVQRRTGGGAAPGHAGSAPPPRQHGARLPPAARRWVQLLEWVRPV